jgi:hypothetical protein
MFLELFNNGISALGVTLCQMTWEDDHDRQPSKIWKPAAVVYSKVLLCFPGHNEENNAKLRTASSPAKI